jgi:AraC family transcriptional regulator
MSSSSALRTQPFSARRLAPVPCHEHRGNCRNCHRSLFAEHQERDLTFGELIQFGDRSVPGHIHENSFYHLVISGGYDESSPRGRVCFQPFSSAFTHSNQKHDGQIAPCGAHFFTVAIGRSWLNEFRELRPEPETVCDTKGGDLTCGGIQLYRELRSEPVACSLTIDALIWEILAAASGMEMRRADAVPAWWGRVLDLIHSECSRGLRTSELAAEAGVHPVHLARVFRRICRQTPGEYVQRLRVRLASEKLSASDEGIAEIAAETGFADQSHFTRIFKRHTRMTPGEFRLAFARRRTFAPAARWS